MYIQANVQLGVNPEQVPMPPETCCNCGSASGVRVVTTTLPYTRFMMLGGVEWELPIALPACETCLPTLFRRHPGRVGPVLAWTVWFGFAFLGVMAGQAALEREVGYSTLILAGVIALGIVSAWYGRRRPVGAQTSWYQPVRVVQLRQRFSGAVTGFTLGFTNERFAVAVALKSGLPAPERRGELWAVRVEGVNR